MPTDQLAALLAPMGADRFFARHFARRRLVLQDRDSQVYAGLPSIDEFERLLASLTSAQAGWFSVVKVKARPPDDAMVTADGVLDLSQVVDAYRAGHSLLLNQVQHRHRATAVLCRGLEEALVERGVMLGRHIGANAYLSPPRSQGFSIHYDPHDVFILQLAGHKVWRLYRQHVRFPTAPPPTPFSPAEAGPLERELTVGPGDLLYLPRGVLHEARTTDEASLHLTLSIEVMTWRDLFRDLATADPRLGEGLPIGFARNGRLSVADRRHILARARALASSRALPATVEALEGRLLADLVPLPSGGLARVTDAAAIDAETPLRLVDGALAHVRVRGDAAHLRLVGATFRGERAMAAAFRVLARGEPFCAAALPIDVSAAEKLAFVRELYAGGHLIRVAPP